MRRLPLRNQDGSALVEMAIASTMLMALMIGIMQACIALYAYHYTAQAARMAARYAMVRGSTSCTNTPSLTNCNATSDEIKTYVQNLGFPGIDVSKINVTTNWCASKGTNPATWSACSSSTSNTPGNEVQVTVSYPYTFAIPFASALSINVTSTSQMLIAQ